MGPDTKSKATIYFTVQCSATVRNKLVLKMVQVLFGSLDHHLAR